MSDLVQMAERLRALASDAAEDVASRWGRKVLHVPGELHAHEMRFGAIFGEPPLLTATSFRQFVRSVRDQGGTSACTGFGCGRAIDIRASLQGKPLSIYPSEQGLYTMGRLLAARGNALVDTGAFLNDVLQTGQDVGVVGETRVPFNPDTINEGCAWDVYRAGSSALSVAKKGLSYYRVFGSVEARRALSKGFPLVIGMSVDASFMDYQGGTYVRGGSIVGGHAMAGIGFSGGCLEVCNSWGVMFGESGIAWIPLEYLDQPDIIFEVYAINVAPEFIQ